MRRLILKPWRRLDYQLRWLSFHIPLTLLLTLGPYAVQTRAAEVIPPSPSPHYVVDAAHVLSPDALAEIDQQLEDFERATSNQLVVAIYPKIQTDDDIAAYAVRVFQAWQIGQKEHDNGVLLLMSIQDHKLTIQVGYGLEGALPDATAKMIIDQEITPRFKEGDYEGGIRAGVAAIIAATKGEYKGNGQVGPNGIDSNGIVGIVVIIAFAIILLLFVARVHRGTLYSSGGSSFWWTLLWILSNSGGNNRGRGRGFGGGGFFGGGGRSGGGGASGSW